MSGTTIPVELSGSGALWTGSFNHASSDGPATFLQRRGRLGNIGTTLTSGTTFVIDTARPAEPLFLRAIPKPAGAVLLQWSAPVDGIPAVYKVYRDEISVSTGVLPQALGVGTFTDHAADGLHIYAVSALDAAGNESIRSSTVSAIADSEPPLPPVDTASGFNAFGYIEVTWQPASQDYSAYQIYRATTNVVNLSVPIAATLSAGSFFSLMVSTPPYVDTPGKNALYYYYLTAFDTAGNESLPSIPTAILWDKAPPTIILTGVQDGGIYNYTVSPVFASTGSATEVTMNADLNGSPFVSGRSLASEGDYVLTVSAVNQSGAGSAATVHFTLDKTPPAISVSGIPAGVSHIAVLPQVTVTDPHLSGVALKLDNAAYTQGVPITANGGHVFTVTANDAAGNTAVSSSAFTLNLPSVAPGNSAFSAVEGLGGTLSWESPGQNIAGYRVYKYGALRSQGLLTALQY